MSTIKYVNSGACISVEDAFVKCALTKSDCNIEAGETFASNRDLQKLDAIGTNCLTNGSLLGLPIGRCRGEEENNICTGDASNCVDPVNFVASDPYCTLQSDSSQQSPFPEATFGACSLPDSMGDGFCAWSNANCPVGYEFQSAGPVSDLREADGLDRCSCEHVKTGACMDNDSGIPYCAVNEDACDETDNITFLTAAELVDLGSVDCRLCEPFDTIDTPDDQEIDPATPASDTEEGKFWREGDDKLSKAAIGGIAAVSAFALVLCILAISCRRRSCGKKKEAAAAGQLENDFI